MDPAFLESNLRGLRRVRIPRYENEFGFTLRHFIVYPPDVYEEIQYPNGETESRVGKVTEPVDTIFVRSVREDGPAYRAGLCVGDRIVSVNGDRIVGRSYEQVVHLIQNSPHYVHLEVSPKQYDTLQLFYEDKAYRPETNQRPSATPQQRYQTPRGSTRLTPSQSLDLYQVVDRPPPPPRRTYYPAALPYGTYATLPHDSPTLSQRLIQRHYAQAQEKERQEGRVMSSAYPNQQPLFSHLPRPPPYKSTTNWSHLSHPPQQQQQYNYNNQQQRPLRQQPQTYYPFQSPEFVKSEGLGSGPSPSPLWGIREEGKSSESVLAGGGSSGSSSNTLNSNRYGSMECLSNNVQVPLTWKNSPGYRFSISTGPGADNPGSLEALRRETFGGPPGGFTSPTNQSNQPEMIVTMSGGANEMPPSSSEYGEVGQDRDRGGMRGYELKMVDRIRRSTEQKEEFLRRPPNQPVQWTTPTASVIGGAASGPFPKEFYAQPQKFQKVPWPPENLLATISSPPGVKVASDELMTVSMRNHPTPAAKQLGLSRGQMEQLRTTYGGSLDETTSRRLESISNKLSTQQSFPKSSHHLGGTGSLRSKETGTTDYGQQGARNRVTMVGSGKLHCDPPKGWKHPTISFDETETHVQNNDTDVILRKRENDPDYENDRLVRRVSYLKATSSPIDMDRKNSTSPTTPTKSEEMGHLVVKPIGVVPPQPPTGRRRSIARFSAEFLPKGSIIRLKQFFEERTTRFGTDSPSAEFRQFGSFPSDKSPDTTEVLREGQVYFKVRAGDAKKGGYYRSWRQGWAQIRRSGCLYLAKDRITKETITGTESDVILSVGLKDGGVSIEAAEDYTKRKNVLRLKTYSPPSSGIDGSTPTGTIPVEILIQGEDLSEMIKWIQILQQQQQENNNTCSNASSTPLRINPNELSSPRSLLRTFLPQGPVTTTTTTGVVQNSNYLTVGSSPVTTTGPLLATSPKSKTWKRRVVKQWKKIHPNSTNSSTPFSSSPLHSQASIPESGATFGVLLEDCPQSESSLVPKILEYCVDLVESKGLGVVGIYRIPGNNAAVSALTESLNKGNEINPETDPRWTDVHVISSLLKSFLRKLPDPLLTSARYQDFIKGAADPDPEKALEKLRSLIQDLPDANYETLRHLTLHLRKVADSSDKNRMEPRNLAIVFGPTVVRTAEENFASLVNDMQHQCKIVELLINNVDEIFKEKEDSPTPPEEPPARLHHPHLHYNKQETQHLEEDGQPPPPMRLFTLPNSSPPKIENDIRTSLIQAALRKKQGVTSGPPHNTYGLPAHPMERDRSVDESGLIRSYAGLGEETEQRVRQFEIETRAHLFRDGRSPGGPVHGSTIYGTTTFSSAAAGGKGPTPLEPTGKLSAEKLRLEAEWKKAKDDLENEDFYDQLADNPNLGQDQSIVEHRQASTNPNLSNSSMDSSTNSGGGGSSTLLPPYGTWPIRLGPVPFKSQFSVETLPPKPRGGPPPAPPFPGVGGGVRKVATGTPPLRKMNSVERLSVESSEFEERTTSPTRQTTQRVKSIETSTTNNSGTFHYDSRLFGSLDSLQNLTNGSKENLSSDGSDLVSSLSKTLEEKMERLRSNENPPSPPPPPLPSAEVKSSRKSEVNGKEGRWGKGLILGKRRNSLIEKETDKSRTNGTDPGNCPQNKEHVEGLNGHGQTGGKELTRSQTQKSKSGAAKSNKGKDVQRRHSLGTVDILRLVLGTEPTLKPTHHHHHHRHSDIHISSETLATALTANNIVESHV